MNPLALPATGQPSAGPRITAVVAEGPADLAAHVPAWEDLAGAALEPNPFYEPWMLLPALRAYGQSKHLRSLLLYAPDPARPHARLLCGFFPLAYRRHYRGLPVGTVSLWQYPHCYLGTPLLRAAFARLALAAFFDWLAADGGGRPLLELGVVPAEGPFHQALVDRLYERDCLTFVAARWTRALLRPAESAEAYLRAAVSGPLRRALKRKHKRLAEAGQLRCESLAPGDDAAAWAEEFLRLEAAGWKGKRGTALACAEADRAFFTEVAAGACRRGRLLASVLRLDGRPVACRCAFRAGEGAFSFKTAYAEDFAAYSPGVLLEVENVRQVHAVTGLRWMDSCTTPDNATINRLWRDRLALQTLLVATGKPPGGLAVSLLPLLRWLKRAALRPFGRTC